MYRRQIPTKVAFTAISMPGGQIGEASKTLEFATVLICRCQGL
jgi:hypothetical protein